MAVEATTGSQLVNVVALLGAAVVMVPLFRRLGLGSVLGYLCAGLLIGPFGLRWFTDPQAILHVAELGVVMFLFVIGLEMRPSHLWSLRREIFGLGALQIAVCTAVLTGVAMLCGLPPATAFIGAAWRGAGAALSRELWSAGRPPRARGAALASLRSIAGQSRRKRPRGSCPPVSRPGGRE